MMMNIGMMLNMLFWIIIIGFAIYGMILLIMKPFENKSNHAKRDLPGEKLMQKNMKRINGY